MIEFPVRIDDLGVGITLLPIAAVETPAEKLDE